ncbi:MAG TPA: hypothetical protein VD757_01945 [Candidatus Nitrosocosmicus sp.]|nr:hypothetical protein [Candidatus Nitrosocosmicus sp.]
MEKFWAVILIFAIVAAGGLLYVNQVYAPQKDAQVAMADTANQTLTAVKMEMDNDETSSTVSAQDVINQVRFYCNMQDDIEIIVDAGSGDVTYTNNSSNIENQVTDMTKQYSRTRVYRNGVLESIRFEVI